MNKIIAKRIVMLATWAAVAALLTNAASAQMPMPNVNLLDLGKHQATAEEREKMNEIDKDYQATIKKVPDNKKGYDPWAGARQDSSNGSTTKR